MNKIYIISYIQIAARTIFKQLYIVNLREERETRKEPNYWTYWSAGIFSGMPLPPVETILNRSILLLRTKKLSLREVEICWPDKKTTPPPHFLLFCPLFVQPASRLTLIVLTDTEYMNLDNFVIFLENENVDSLFQILSNNISRMYHEYFNHLCLLRKNWHQINVLILSYKKERSNLVFISLYQLCFINSDGSCVISKATVTVSH